VGGNERGDWFGEARRLKHRRAKPEERNEARESNQSGLSATIKIAARTITENYLIDSKNIS